MTTEDRALFPYHTSHTRAPNCPGKSCKPNGCYTDARHWQNPQLWTIRITKSHKYKNKSHANICYKHTRGSENHELWPDQSLRVRDIHARNSEHEEVDWEWISKTTSMHSWSAKDSQSYRTQTGRKQNANRTQTELKDCERDEWQTPRIWRKNFTDVEKEYHEYRGRISRMWRKITNMEKESHGHKHRMRISRIWRKIRLWIWRKNLMDIKKGCECHGYQEDRQRIHQLP